MADIRDTLLADTATSLPRCSVCRHLRYNGLGFFHFCAEVERELPSTLITPDWCPLKEVSHD